MSEIKTAPGTAIIATGGGMRSAHGAGFLFGLTIDLNMRSPDIIIGSSGNAACAFYFATGEKEQLHAMQRIWTKRLSTPKFISYSRFRRIIDIDYLVDIVFKEQEPLDTNALRRSPIRYYIPLTNAVTGETRYVTREDNADPFEVLRASTALPVFFGKKITLPWGKFIDGESGPTLEDHIHKAVSKGARNILIIDNASDGRKASRLRKLLYRLFAHTKPIGLRKAILRDTATESVCLTSEHAKLLCVRPRTLPVDLLTRNAKKIQKAFEKGRSDAIAMKEELAELFN